MDDWADDYKVQQRTPKYKRVLLNGHEKPPKLPNLPYLTLQTFDSSNCVTLHFQTYPLQPIHWVTVQLCNPEVKAGSGRFVDFSIFQDFVDFRRILIGKFSICRWGAYENQQNLEAVRIGYLANCP